MTEMSQCTKCGAIKDREEFPHRMGAACHSSVCNECVRSATASRNREYRKRNGEAINARLQARRLAAKTRRPAP
jgi:hypothetical protein